MIKKTNSSNTLGTKELCEYLGISMWMAQSLMRSKSFPSFRIGRFWKVTKDDLDNWINKQKQLKDLTFIKYYYN